MYAIGEVARLLGVSITTLRRWDRKRVLCPIRTKGGHRRYKREDLGDWLPEAKIEREVYEKAPILAQPLLYGRVSSPRQETDGNLDRQVDRLIRFTKKKHGHHVKYHLIKEYGSGLNPKRAGLQRVIRLVKQGKVSEVVVAYRDRLSRFGTEYLEALFDVFHVPLIVAEQGMKTKTLLEELLNDFMSLLACFSGKMYKGRALQGTADERYLKKETRMIKEVVAKAIFRAENDLVGHELELLALV